MRTWLLTKMAKQMQSSAERCPLTVARHLSVRQLSNKLGGKSAAKDMACSSLALRMGNCPLYVDRLVMRRYVRSYYIYVHVPKPKMQISWSHLEVANVRTPLVSIVVSRAVAKGLALAPISRTLFAVALALSP